MNSPGHRKNLMGDYNLLGAGAFYGNGKWVATQKFMKTN